MSRIARFAGGALSPNNEAQLKEGGLSTDLEFFVGSHPPAKPDLGRDTAGDNDGSATGATFDAPHPTQGWYGIRQDDFTDRVRYSAEDMDAAIGGGATQWTAIVFLTVEDMEDFGCFYAAPYDDDAHTSPFFNFAFNQPAVQFDNDARYIYWVSGTNLDNWQTTGNSAISQDNLPHWIAVVCDTGSDEAEFFFDGNTGGTINTSNATRNFQQAAGIGNDIVIGNRNDVDTGEGMKGQGHAYCEWIGRKLSAAEILELVEDPTKMVEVRRDPRRPSIANVSTGGERLGTPAANNDFTVNHTTEDDHVLYVWAWITSSEGTTDTPTVTVKFEIASVESGTVEDITPDDYRAWVSDEGATFDGMPTGRLFRITGATTGAGVITVDVSFSGAGEFRIGGAIAFNVENDGGVGFARLFQPTDPTTDATGFSGSFPLNTALSRHVQLVAIRGGSRTVSRNTLGEVWQRTHVNNNVIGSGQSFETRQHMWSRARPIAGRGNHTTSWTGGGDDYCACMLELLPTEWNAPYIRDLFWGADSQASGQTAQATCNIRHHDTPNRAILVLATVQNDSASAQAPTVTAKWEISSVESGTVIDLSLAALDDAEDGLPSVHAFLITGATAGNGTVTVDADMGGGNDVRSLQMAAIDMDNVGEAGATASARTTSPVTELEFSITPENPDSKIFVITGMKDFDHASINPGLTIDGPNLIFIESGSTASQDHSMLVWTKSNRMTEAQDARTRWTNADPAAAMALEIKPA